MADYPNQKSESQKNINYPVGHKGLVIDEGVEGREVEKDSIRNNSQSQPRSAGHIKSTNVNHST